MNANFIDPEERSPFMVAESFDLETRLHDAEDLFYCLRNLALEVEAADLEELMTFLRSNQARKRKWANQIGNILDALGQLKGTI